MKEDAQLICPISYYDPSGQVWDALQQEIYDRLPLRDVSWKSTGTISSTQAAVEKLPLRFMPSTASLFKDTDHPFRWFLAPYANIFFINVDNFESYKDAKPAIRKWVETIVGLKRASWLLVYAPIFQGFQTPDSAACNKVYSKLSSDFYADRAGDRTVNLIPVSVVVPSHSEDSIAAAYVDFFSKLREGIVYSFFHRSAQYDSDIRRLDSCRGTSQFDFRQLFLVKESLALMYQLMQLPQEALRQYGELEALLSVVPVGTLPDNDWPLPVVDDSGVGLRKIGMGTGTGTGNDGEIANALGTVGAECAAEENAVDNFKSFWKDPMREGENILLYSINSARMRVLKNKIGIRELRRYLFARQIHFLAQQHKGRECAVKALQYVTDTYDSIVRDLSTSRLEREQRLRQADLWALCAAVKIVRSCRGYICRQQEHEQKEAKSESITLADTAGITIDVIGTGAETGDLADLELHFQSSAVDRETLLLRELSAPLGELLQLAIKRLNSLSSFFVTKISSSSSDVVDNPSRDVESHSSRESYCYGDIALSLAQSLYVPQNHLQKLHETSGGTANHELVGQPVADEADGDIMLIALLSMPMLHDGADSAAVEDCLHAELDKALELFATHLHAVLTQGTIKLQHRNLPPVLHSAALDGVVDMRHPSWCPLSVLLLRALASHEELIQRFRIAKRSRMECADVLLCHGHYHLASTCYSGAILRKSSVGSRGGAPATKTLWDELDRIALLKILYCAAAIKNRVEYMRAALLLRAMELQDSLDKNTASNSCTREGEFLSTSCRPYLVGHDGNDADSAFPFRFYFEVASAALVRDDHSESPTTPSSPHTARHKSPSLSSSSDSKTLQLWAGAAYKLELRLFSLFPCCVHLDEVSVLYTFDETHDTIATAGIHLYDICARSRPLESDDGRAVDATMLLSPGLSRTLTLNFTAPARSGSYSPSEARVSVISEVASIVFIGGKDQQRINGSGTFTLRATASSVLGELPHFVIVERNLSSSTLEQLSVPSMRQECFSGVDSKNPPAFVDLLDVAVLSPHLLPLPLSALAKALLGNSARNAENPERCWREFIVQMKFGNSTQVTRYISAFHLCDPQCSLRDLSRLDTLFAATSDDTSPKDDRKLEIVFLESHLGIELEGIVSSINCVTLLPGETYCAAFNLLLGQLETESSTVSVSTGEGGIREGSVACPTLLVFLEEAGDSGPNREMLVGLSTCILRFYNAVRSGVSPTIVLPSEESFNALASNINNSAGITKAAFRARLCSRIVRRTKIQSNSMRMLTKAIRLEDASSSVIWTVLSPSNSKGLVQ